MGQDVFEYGHIGPKNEDKFIRLMQAFKLLIDLYEVDEYYACATSAMRESENGHKLVQKVEQLIGLKINIISGENEASLINSVVLSELGEGHFLHIDVGGGSTELNFISSGKKLHSASFKIGSVRGIKKSSSWDKLKRMELWIQEHLPETSDHLIAVGTGGNVVKLFELSTAKSSSRQVSLEQIQQVQEELKQLSTEELIYKLHLNPDRADVILPASRIYVAAMKAAGANEIKVPDVGLKDGIMKMLFEKHVKQTEIYRQ